MNCVIIKGNTNFQREAEKECNKTKKQNAELRNYAIFGKFKENPVNKVDVKIGTTSKQYLQWLFQPSFKRDKKFRNGATAIKKEEFQPNFMIFGKIFYNLPGINILIFAKFELAFAVSALFHE